MRLRADFDRFAREKILPYAAEIDEQEQVPRHIIEDLAQAGYFASGLPEDFGGIHEDPVLHGLMHEAMGGASASVQGVLNVHHMAASPIMRWGTAEQKALWLPRLACGSHTAAFAITEPRAGSDAAAVETQAERQGDEWVLSGVKKWITCGAHADVFVMLARCPKGPTVFIVPADSPGLKRRPITGLLGCRGYMLAELVLDQVRLPANALLGAQGFGLTHIASVGLDAGRYNLAWACVGMAEACLKDSKDYASKRTQFGSQIHEFQLIAQMITQMIVSVRAARLLCWQAAHARQEQTESAGLDAMIAKYYASTTLNDVAAKALQVHGAVGVAAGSPIQRHLRDARIMEIIETSTQVLELMIAKLDRAAEMEDWDD
nr:acyl-CoA dehydrogenase family protein [Acanthopleuribacter pedis]